MRQRKKIFSEKDISPDEIFLDAKNMPNFSRESFEGVMEKTIAPAGALVMAAVFGLVLIIMIFKVGILQFNQGEAFYQRAKENRLRLMTLFPERGVIYDRRGLELAWNDNFAGEIIRVYTNLSGLSHLLGYMGFFSEEELAEGDFNRQSKYGRAGLEKGLDDFLRGQKGRRLVEVDSLDRIISESVQQMPENGADVALTIDAEMQSKLFEKIQNTIKDRGFKGGAGIVMNPQNGEILAMTSWPEYDSNAFSKGEAEKLPFFLNNEEKPLFFRAVSGLYSPGSTIKPIIALAALEEGVIDKDRSIFSAGSISVTNPYDSDKNTVFYDWKAHGWVDMRRAIAVSSNVYFYTIGGGFEDIGGLGVSRLKKYFEMFGLGKKTGLEFLPEEAGFVPDPEWKEKYFSDKIWRVGDTYNLSIGQGWLEATPLQMAAAASIISRNGERIKPHLLKEMRFTDKNKKIDPVKSSEAEFNRVNIEEKYFKIVKEGMKIAVEEGTAQALSGLGIEIGAKTGTAQIGGGKVDSWLIAFAPYDNPRLVLTIVLEGGNADNLVGAPFAARQFFEWLILNRPEYLTVDNGVDPN
ncbi:MAG: penicillin-binding transpeptidase domain-containing protein [Patescibacteria group bacterium]